MIPKPNISQVQMDGITAGKVVLSSVEITEQMEVCLCKTAQHTEALCPAKYNSPWTRRLLCLCLLHAPDPRYRVERNSSVLHHRQH